MPDGRVTIEITADASGVQRGAQQAEQSLSGIERQASSGLGFGVMAGIGQKAFDLVTGAASKALQAIEAAVDVGSKFEAQMSKVEAISGAAASDMALLTDKAKEMGSTTIFSATEAGQALQYMAMAGWKTTDMLNGIEGIMDLAAASGEDLAKTSDIVTDALTAFGLTAKDSGKFADVLATASSNANTNVSLMGETFKYVGATAGALNYSIEDIALATGLMANAGIKGSMAGTALRSTITRLASPTKQTRDAMEKLGLSITDSEGNALSFREVMLQMRSGFAGLSEAEQAATAKMLGGAQAMSGLLAVVNASDEDFNKLANAIDNSNGSAAQMADTMTDNLQGSLTKFGSAAEGLGIAVYDAIKGPLSGLVDFGTAVISGITGLLTRERSDLELYLDDVRKSGEVVEAAIESSKKAMADSEAEIGKLTAYKKVMLEVVEAGHANEYQAYLIEKALSEIGDTMPEITAAWDAETRTLKTNTDTLEKNFDERIKIAKLEGISKAESEAARAVGEAYVMREKAIAGEQAALEKLNDELGLVGDKRLTTYREFMIGMYSNVDWDSDKTSKKAREIASKAANDVQEAEQKVADAEETFNLVTIAVTNAKKALGLEAEEAGNAAEANGQNAEKTKEAAEATDHLSEAARRMSDSYITASDTVTKAFDTIKSSLENAFSVNMFESWDEKNQKGAGDMINALNKQEEALKRYKTNMDKLRENLKGEENADDFLQWLTNAGEAGARTVAELASNTDLAKKAVKEYAEAFDASETLTNSLTMTNVALLLGLDKLGSTAEEWEGLEDVVAAKVTMSGADAALAGSLQAVAETAREMGVAIPEGLAEAILSSDDPTEAISSAVESLESAILGHAEAVVAQCEKLGLDVPESIKAGIESGGEEAKKAYDDLIALMGGSDALQKAKDAGKQGGEKATEGQAEGVKAKEQDVVAASQQNAQAAANAVRNEKYNMAAAGQELSEAGAGGTMSSILKWTEAGMNIARGFAQGIRSGKNEAVNAAAEISAAAVSEAKRYNVIESPSHLYRDKIGYMIAKGWSVGMAGGAGLVANAAKELGGAAYGEAQASVKKIDAAFDKMKASLEKGAKRGRFASTFEAASTTASKTIEAATQTAEDTLKRASERYFTGLFDTNAAKIEQLQAQQDRIREQYNATQDKTLRASLEAQETAIKTEIDGLKKRQTKLSKLSGEFASSVFSSYNAALDAQADKITTRLNSALEKAANTAQDKIDELNGKIAGMKSGLLNIGDVWDGATFGRGLIVNVKNQIAQIEAYEDQIKALAGRGISKTLLSEIEGMDAESASGYMAALLGLSDKDLKQYDKLFRKRAKEAQRISEEHYADEVQAVKDNYTSAIEAAFEQAEKDISSMGEKAMAGFLKGMKSSDYSREIRKIARNIVKSMADELEIHSPSRKAEKLGIAYAAGWNQGVERSTAKTEEVMEKYAGESLAAFRDALGLTEGIKATFAAPDIGKAAFPMPMAAAAPELASVPAAVAGGKDYTITLITTLDGREIARGTAQYTEAELAKRQTIQARREGYL